MVRLPTSILAASLVLAASVRAAGPASPFLSPALSGRSAPASGVTFAAGAGRYAFSSGTAWEVVDGAGRPLGLWVRGEGRLEWTTADAGAMKVYRENAGRVGGLVTPKGGPISARLEEALFLFTRAARPAGLPEPREGSAAEAPARELAAFLARWEDDALPPPAVGLSVGAAGDRAYFVGLLAAAKDARHEVDDARVDLDTLTVVERPVGLPVSAGPFRVGRTVATHPLGRSTREAPRADFVVTELSVDVRETTDARGILVVEETIVPARPAAALAFELRGLSLSPRLLSRRETAVEEVSLGDGTPLPFLYAGGVLAVFPPKPLAAGVPARLRFRYDAPFFERDSDNYWELPLAGAWYPQPSALMVQARHGMRSVVRAKKPLLPIAPGRTIRRFEDGDWNGVEAAIDTAVPFHSIVAGRYTLFEETKGGVTARVATYGLAKPMSAAKVLSLFHALREFYEPYFGPFPWAEYTIVEVNSYGFGQAPPGLMRITREAFESNKFTGDLEAQVFSEGVNQRFAHEIAHAWWGGVVWNAQDADRWLVEAFAQMASARALEMLKSEGDYDRLHRRWRADAKEAASRAPIPLASELVARAAPGAGDSVYPDAVLLTYGKGPTLLVALRREIGDAAFFTAMKSLLKSFATRRPALLTSDFVGLLEFMTKKDWKPWFERYFYGTEVP